LPVSASLLPSEVITKICAKIKQKSGVVLNEKNIRLRERHMNKLVKIYRELPMKKQGLNEKKMLTMEVMEEEVPEIKAN